jgi:hypothetical protein
MGWTASGLGRRAVLVAAVMVAAAATLAALDAMHEACAQGPAAGCRCQRHRRRRRNCPPKLAGDLAHHLTEMVPCKGRASPGRCRRSAARDRVE